MANKGHVLKQRIYPKNLKKKKVFGIVLIGVLMENEANKKVLTPFCHVYGSIPKPLMSE